jgi:hypothetical protein
VRWGEWQGRRGSNAPDPHEGWRYGKLGLLMSITIELAPELQAELARQAATQGVGIDAYAAGLLEDAARRSESSPPSRQVLEAIERLTIRPSERHMDSRSVA